MKNRFLPFRFFVLIPGLIVLSFSSITFAGNPGSKVATDRMQQIRVNQNTGTIDAMDMLKAQDQVNKMSMDKSMSDISLSWNQLGPNNAAGRTRTVLFSNKDKTGQTILTGGVAGGIWKSRNLGLTWHEMNTQSNEVLRVTSMVQTSGGTIYVATGESYCGNNQNIGTGIYVSNDDSTFTVIPGTQPVANDPSSDWAYIAKLAVNLTTGRVFAATNAGLEYSDDGTTWLTAMSGYAYTVTVGPDGTILTNINNLAYIAVGGDITNFVKLSTGTSTTFPATGVSSMEFAIAPSDPNTMYASLINNLGNMLNIYKSSDKGTTWTVVFPGNNTIFPITNGCYANSLAVFPNDPDQIFLGGNNIWHGKQYQPTGYYNWEQFSFNSYDESFFDEVNTLVPINQHQILFSPVSASQFAIATDDGITIGTTTSSAATFSHRIKNCIISQFSSVACSITPDAALGSGVYIGTVNIPGDNSLDEPENMEQINPEFNNGEVARSLIYPTSIYFPSGASNPPFTRSEDLGVTPSPTFMSSITNANYAPVSYWEDFNFTQSTDSITFVVKAGPIAKDSMFDMHSANEKFPIHYTAPHNFAVGDTIKAQDVVQTRFFISGSFSSYGTGIMMTKEALQYSVDPAWFKIGTVLSSDIISCITVSKDLGVLWAGTTKGRLYRLTNITYAQDSMTAWVGSSGCVIHQSSFDTSLYPQFKNRYITSIAIAPGNNNTVMVTLGNYGNSNYIYTTTDGLDSIPVFTAAQGNLPAMPVYSGIFEMSHPDLAIVGTDFGVFSTDVVTAGSPGWSSQYTGAGNVPVTMITQQTNPGLYYWRPTNYGDMYISSFGRGLFYDSSYSVILGVNPVNPKPVAQNRLKIQPNPFTGEVYLSYNLEKTTPVRVLVYDLSGRMIFSTSYGTQQPGQYLKTLNLGNLTEGTYIIKLDYGSGSLFGKAMKIN